MEKANQTFHDLMNHRSSLMGLSILWIYLYHSEGLQLEGCAIIEEILFYASVGVDIFFFLSAIGLYLSLERNPSASTFFRKRVLRILPTWWFFLFAFFLIAWISGDPHPETIGQGLLYLSGLGWWFNGLYSNSFQVSYEWYIPTLLMFYLFTPLLHRLRTRPLLILVAVTAVVSLLFAYTGLFDSLWLSYQRIPIFLSGLLFGRWLSKGFPRHMTPLCRVSFVLGIGLFLLSYLFTEHFIGSMCLLRLAVLLAMPLLLQLFAALITRLRLTIPLAFLGGITLELYLVHIYNLPLNLVSRFIPVHALAVLVNLLLCTLVATGVQRMLAAVMNHSFIPFKK